MRRGKVSYSKVRAVTRVATPENEQTLLDAALAGTAAHVERIARAWAAHRPERGAGGGTAARGEPGAADVGGRGRDGGCPGAFGAGGGGGAAAGTGGGVRRAPASDGGAEEEAADPSAKVEAEAADGTTDSAEPTLAQRQADAIGTLAEAELGGRTRPGDGRRPVSGGAARGRGGTGRTAGRSRGNVRGRGTRIGPADRRRPRSRANVRPRGVRVGPAGRRRPRSRANVRGRGVGIGAAGRRPTRSRGNVRPRGVRIGAAGRRANAFPRERWRPRAAPDPPGGSSPLHTEMPGRAGRARQRRRHRASGPCPGAQPTTAACRQTVLDEAGGIHVSAETARRLACDAATVGMRHGPGGEIFDVGRRTRTISPALRRALAARDRQCRFPGCGNARSDAHHLKHWADGGRTALDHLVLLWRPPHGSHKSFI